MTTEFNPIRQCSNKTTGLMKKRFFTKKEAKQYARKMSIGTILQAYRCPHCDYYHLGNKIPKDLKQS